MFSVLQCSIIINQTDSNHILLSSMLVFSLYDTSDCTCSRSYQTFLKILSLPNIAVIHAVIHANNEQ